MSHPKEHRARGFTLIELLVSIAIGLFLIGGLLTLVQAMRRTSTNQSGMSSLQDNERMAMEIITDVVQSTGYYVNPLSNSATASFSAVSLPQANFTFAGQALVGTGTWAVADHVITTRYQTNGIDNVINCTGNVSTVATPAVPVTWTNQLFIDTSGTTKYLACKLWTNGANPTTVDLIPNVTNMQIQYGVSTGQGAPTNSVDAYLDATNVASGTYWNVVRSVQITLTFVNPMANQPGQTATVSFTRVIDVMSSNGVTS
jgi:type IV pilus assembly protein PilW